MAHVPEVDEPIAADGGEGGVVGAGGEVEDFVAVGAGVALDELLGGGFGRVGEVDGAVGGAGEDLK